MNIGALGPTPADITNCDREPIHIPGAILPHGAMLVLDSETLEVLQVAGDLTGLLGASADALLGCGLIMAQS
jgi:light-regulated signal transduction histidine kinase (bacteriophytochrome)